MQPAEFEMPGQRYRFLTHPFHQASIAREDIGDMIDEFITERGIHDPLGQCHSYGFGNALAESPVVDSMPSASKRMKSLKRTVAISAIPKGAPA